MSSGKKRGALSKSERQFIEDNANKMDTEKIAELLNRNPDPIQRYLFKVAATNKNVDETYHELKAALESKYYWREIKLQFNEDEQQYFMDMWVDLMRQFNNDVLPAEEHQIKELVRLDIIINRNMAERAHTVKEIDRIRASIEHEKKKPEEARNMEMIIKLQETISYLYSSRQSYMGEHAKLLDRKKDLTRDLKASRDQRIKAIESSKENFTSWLKTLDDEVIRRRAGEDLGKVHIGEEKVRQQLGGWHTFEDGEVDQPLLNEFTVKEREEYE